MPILVATVEVPHRFLLRVLPARVVTWHPAVDAPVPLFSYSPFSQVFSL